MDQRTVHTVPQTPEGLNGERRAEAASVPFFRIMSDEEYLAIYNQDGNGAFNAVRMTHIQQYNMELQPRGHDTPFQSPDDPWPELGPVRQPLVATVHPWERRPHDVFNSTPPMIMMNPGRDPVNTVEKDPFNLGVFLEADGFFAACENNKVTKEDLQGLVKHRETELAKANNVAVPFNWNAIPNTISSVSNSELISFENEFTSKLVIMGTEKDDMLHQPFNLDGTTKVTQELEQRLHFESAAKFHQQRKPTPGLLFPTTPESVTTFPTWDNNISGPETSDTSFHAHGGCGAGGHGQTHRSSNSQRKRKERECGSGISRREQRQKHQHQQRRNYGNEPEPMCIYCFEAGRPNEVVRTHTMLDENTGRLLCKFLTGEYTFK